MKKILLTLALASLALAGCSNNKSNNTNNQSSNNENSSIESSSIPSSSEAPTYDYSSLSIVSPTGAPALAFYQYADKANFETNAVPTNIVPMMVAGQKDVVVLPTNAGVQAIVNRQAPYKLAATITFGNFYLISMGNDTNETLDTNDKILLFQKGNVPDKIFHYVYGNDLDSAIYYVEAASDAATAAISGKFVDGESGENLTPNYVLLAEPALTNVMSKKEGLSVYADIQAKYKEKSNGLPIFQASVFIKNSVEADLGNTFLDSLKNDINAAIEKPELLSAGLSKSSSPAEQYGVAPAMAEAVLKKNNGMGLGFAHAKENKDAVNAFLSIFNIAELNEENYY